MYGSDGAPVEGRECEGRASTSPSPSASSSDHSDISDDDAPREPDSKPLTDRSNDTPVKKSVRYFMSYSF